MKRLIEQLQSVVRPQFAYASTRRLGFFQTPNGISMPYWTPKQAGANFEFTEPLKALEPLRKQVTVLSGLNNYCAGLGDGGGPHTRGYAAWLSGMLAQRTEVHPMLGVTADQYAARTVRIVDGQLAGAGVPA